MLDLTIQNGSTLLHPSVEEGITWDTSRQGTPGKLEFNVLKSDGVVIEEGSAVRLVDGSSKIFYGFVFTKKYDQGDTIKVTAYDQLRYLKAKDIRKIGKVRADQIISQIAADYGLKCGVLANTGYVLPGRIEDNTTMFDIIQNALDDTVTQRKTMYVLYDDFGALTLKNIEDMKLNLMIDKDSAEGFDYGSSIDIQTYNRVKLDYFDSKTKLHSVYAVQDDVTVKKWGVLQYYEKVQTGENIAEKAKALLGLYNAKTKDLSVKNVIGDYRVRAGSSLVVSLDLGDITVLNYMLVENAKHRFENSSHLMDLTLRGGDFIV